MMVRAFSPRTELYFVIGKCWQTKLVNMVTVHAQHQYLKAELR